MILTLSVYVTLTLSAFVFILLAFTYYWTVLKKLKRFPVYHLIPNIIHFQVTRKKDDGFSNFLFQMMADMYKKHSKDGFCMSYGTSPILFLFKEEELIKMFLSDKAAVDKSKEYKMFEDSFGPGLISSNGERWRNHRKVISRAFSLGMLKEKVPLFNEHALALVEDLKTVEGKLSADFQYFIKRHYFNALSESIFGLKQSTENEVENLKYFHIVDKTTDMIMYRAFQPWLWHKFGLRFLPSGREYLRQNDEIYNFIKNVILKMKKRISSNTESDDTEYFSKSFNKSFTYLLLQHHLKDPSFTFKDLHGEVNTLMVAGYDTVSYTTMWCLFMLGLHPQLQEKAFEEVQSIYHNYITYDEMDRLTYLNAFIMETLRLYPTVPLYARLLSEDVQYDKYKIHKGTTIAFSVFFWHRNPDNYPDPEKFDPERFLSAEKTKPGLHVPFAEGIRVCLGKKYALIEMKIFLAHILYNFKIISLDKREDVKLCYNVVLTPEKPLRMLIKPRTSELF